MQARILYLYALSPIHSGTGQSTDVIDLPVARETVFNWPYLPGSRIKGVLRDVCAPNGKPSEQERLFTAAFGPDTQHAAEGAGALWFGDFRLLCLPVRSYAGTLAWVTCPLALRRWQRDHLSSGLRLAVTIPAVSGENGILVPAQPASKIARQGAVYLEDLDLAATTSSEAETIAQRIAEAVLADAKWQHLFQERFGIVSDDLFTFLTETATEVVARIKLRDDAKTVEKGGLWYEEAIPAESILYGPILAAPRQGQTAEALYGVLTPHLKGLIQIGGNASVGRGLVDARLWGATP
ncbi:MAG: type III-B CRISPR module RAMP protein Cmr4 [Chloroflexi bacterium]|nr:type III-B CRISPR module RAMP protein Cmr4 [Chloroflexota bacterium]